jgi:hypothetical protein
VCANCGEVIEGKAIPAGHKWGAWNVAKQATLTKQGEKKRECTVCGETETQATPYTIKGAKVVLVNAVFTYNGKVRKPTVKTIGGKTLKYGTDYTVTYKNNKNVGKGTLTIKGKGKYTGTATKTFKINKAANPLTVKAKAAKVKKSKVKKKAQKLAASKVMTVSKQQGKLTYAKVSGSKKLTITKAGKVTVKKKTKKGTYKMRVKVTAAGNANYKAGSKTVTVKVRVK